MFSILIGLVILAFPVVAISALVLAIGASDRTRELNLRFAALCLAVSSGNRSSAGC